MTTDPNTLDPNEIRSLPMRRDLPYNGLSVEQVRAIGGDPEAVEAARIATNEYTAQQQFNEEALIAASTRQAIADGVLTESEAATGLRGLGLDRAHQIVVEDWKLREAQEQAGDIVYMSAEDYAAVDAARLAFERGRAEKEVVDVKQQIREASAKALQDDLDALATSLPGYHAIAGDVAGTLIADLGEKDELPSTPEDRAAAIESALRRSAIVSKAQAEVDEQVKAEWRSLRSTNRGHDGLITQSDLDAAERAYKEARTKQLQDVKLVNVAEFAPSRTAEEESAALTEKFKAAQAGHDDFARNAHDMAKRGKEASTRDRGEFMTADRTAFKEAMARAEETAQWGTPRTSLNPAAPEEKSARLDEYGDAFGRPV